MILTPTEISLVEGLLELLKVFDVFTKYIQGDKYPTLNVFPVFYAEMENELLQIIDNTTNAIIRKAAEIMYSKLNSRLPLRKKQLQLLSLIHLCSI